MSYRKVSEQMNRKWNWPPPDKIYHFQPPTATMSSQTPQLLNHTPIPGAVLRKRLGQNRGRRPNPIPNPISNPKSYPKPKPNPIPNPKPNLKCYRNTVRSSPTVLPTSCIACRQPAGYPCCRQPPSLPQAVQNVLLLWQYKYVIYANKSLILAAEFLCFYGILRNLVLAGDIGDKYGTFWWSSGHRTVCIHDFSMKYMTATRAVAGGILKILSWAYLKYCRLIW